MRCGGFEWLLWGEVRRGGRDGHSPLDGLEDGVPLQAGDVLADGGVQPLARPPVLLQPPHRRLVVVPEVGLRESVSRSVVSNSASPRTVAHQAPLPWDPLGRNTAVGCRFLLQGSFPAQGSHPRLLRCRWSLYHLSPGEGTI